MLMPPVKAIFPSTTSDLRWLRRLMVATCHGVKIDAGRNLANGIFAWCKAWVIGGHAALDGAFERGDKLFSARVVVENVSAERDGFFRGFNRGEHGRKRFVAVDERFDFIPGGERLRDDAADDAGDVFEMFRAVVFRLAEIFGNGTARNISNTSP